MLPSDTGASSIVVAVRVRPFTIREAAQLAKTDDGTLFLGDGSLAAAPAPKLNQKGLRSVIKVVDDRCLVFDPPEDNPVQKFSRSVVPATGKRVKDQVFAFDRIFDDNASQMDVYEGTTKGLLDSVLDGYNATVFAYGATGCGKTHTITGTAQQPGIIFMTMQELFEKISERSDDKVTELSLSYLEIYNETIRDLLVPGGSKQGLMLREDTNQAVTVAGLTSHHPRDVQEVMDMIVQGNEFRTVSPTEANAVSSRSHAVLQINVAQRDRNASVSEPHTMATLSIIDLAGSERASATKNRGERLLEGANINKSLLALGGCINALCDPRKKNHVPYRNSKLTRLLKFSLGGNCKTVMIVCVSPSSAHFDETQNTLRYANRAKNIQTKVTRNVFNVNRHVKDFLVKIDEQMALINELKAQQKDAEHAFGLKVRKQLDKRDLLAREGVQRIRVAYENALPERQQKVSDMKKLRTVERRLATLAAWADAFDLFGEQPSGVPGDADADAEADAAAPGPAPAPAELPPALAAMRKTTRGIMAELEHSRHHLHQKIERSNWERPLDSALQHSMAQMAAAAVDSVAAADTSEAMAVLTREAELLKANFAREAYIEVLEQEKTTGSQTDMLMLQTLLSAQFTMMASLASTLAMPRDQAVAHGQRLVRKLLDAGVAATSQIVKPDPSLSASTAGTAFSASTSSSGRFSLGGMDAFPPSKRGTPRRTRSSMMGGAAASHPAPVRSSLGVAAQQHLAAATSPTRSSPRRRKVVSGAGRKSVSMPSKRKSAGLAGSIAGSARRDSNASSSSFKRSVRWRDDETEAGTLADFEKTPQKLKAASSPENPVAIVDAPPADAEDQEEEEQEAGKPAFADTNSIAQPLPESAWSTMETVPEADEETPSPLAAHAAHASPPSPELPPLALPSYLSRTDLVETDEDDDSSLNAPDTSILPGAGMAATSSAGPAATSNRFQAGFLSKSRASLSVGMGGGAAYNSSSDAEYPTPPSLSASLNGTGGGARKSTPLRNISLPRAANQQRTPPSATRIASLSSLHGSGSPKTRAGLGGITSVSGDNENQPPSSSSLTSYPPTRLRSPSPRLSLSASNSDAETTTTLHDLPSTFDTNKLRSAIHSAKKAKAAAAAAGSGGGSGGAGNGGGFSSSVLLGSGGSGARRFSVGGAHRHGHHRASASYSGPHTLASSTNGISRQRRRSAERRRSPPIACSPLVSDSSSGTGGGGHHHYRDGAVSRALTPGQARRMNMGGSLRLDSSSGGATGSPREREPERGRVEGKTAGAATGGMRRVTIGTAAMGGLTNGHTNGHSSSGSIGGSARKDTSSRPNVAWR
ncbi:kinesin family member 18/19 [Sporothrix schenckii 1099-18]|uniref:Kinesin family member 18/19 n=1 Tax=Sporothrix schenckii 1099-18 TaxID=1397361 RepID=A0A0F2MGV2_SPOSC|nr:kinesin family member 18/19 [Sporothrix schenckii 1099-18]KJR88928.1 kinesin family member 18/19 [Sporothrix schenckii 1099-18]